MMTHKITEYKPDYPPAYLANGVIGLRVGKIPLLNGTAMVNGFASVHDLERTEGLAPTIYPVGCDIFMDRIQLSLRPELACFREQSLDFATGELNTRFDFTVNGTTARVNVLTLCCRSLPNIAMQEVRVEVDRKCKLTIRACLDPTGLPGEPVLREVVNPGWTVADGCMLWRSRGGIATCGAAFLSGFSEKNVEKKRNFWGYNGEPINSDYAVEAQPGHEYIMWQMGSLVPSLMHPEPDRQAIHLVGISRYRTFEALRRENREAWAELWKGRVRLLGSDARWQDIVDSAFFYLHSSIHQSSPCSIGAWGLGCWKEYLGHVFWDAETWELPSVLLTAPHAARAMLDYRTRLLPAARRNAALNGYRGVQFPWESCTTGAENIPAWAVGIFREHHINTDVAFAFAQYAHATGEKRFLREQAWPVLEGVAEWLDSRVVATKRGYEIHGITGIDEGVDDAKNNCYTNMSAIVVLREAISAARQLDYPVPPAWEDMAARMYVPVDPKTNVIIKHEGFEYKSGICVPEALVAMFPLTYRPAPQIEDATRRYYVDAAETYVRFPFIPLSAVVSAARQGDRKRTADLLDAILPSHVVPPFMQFIEFAGQGGQGIGGNSVPIVPYIANAGSIVTAWLLGLTGLVLGPDSPQTWGQFPITMPDGCDGVEVERIWVRGKPAHLLARHGERQAKIE